MNSPTSKPISSFAAARGIAFALAAFSLALFLPTSRAAARGATDAADDPAYRKLVEEGLAEYDARHFEEARSLFRRAHEISPNARTFRGMGMTSFELRDYVSAVHNLAAALKDEHKPLSAEQRERTQDLLDRSRIFVDVYTLTVSPPSARVLVDGRTPEYEPDGTLMFGFGAHTVEVRARDMVTRTLPISVKGGERKELTVTLEPVVVAPVATTESTAATAVEPLPPAGSNAGAVAWLIAGGGAALLAGGAGYYLYDRQTQLDSCHHPAPGLLCTNESSITTWRNVALGTTIGAGAAALTMALIGILSWESGPAASQPPSALNCIVSPLGFSCGRSF
ncbi:MAG: tetratricopeptide repeat protein [Polyangia bacterium]